MNPTRSLSTLCLLTLLAGCAMQNVESGIGDEDVLGINGDDDVGDKTPMDVPPTDFDAGSADNDTGTTNPVDNGIAGQTDRGITMADAGVDRPATDVGFPTVDTGIVSRPDVPVLQDSGPPDTGIMSSVCDAPTTCGGCTALGPCGWCGTTNRCQQGSSTGPTGSTCATWSWISTSCTTASDPCSTSHGCGSCTDRGGCGWCGDTDTCRTGRSGGPTSGSCFDWTWSNFLGICF